MLINHVDPKTFWKFNPKDETIKVRSTDAPKAGGITKGLDEVATPAESSNKMAMPRPGEKFPLPKKDRSRLRWLVSKISWPKGGKVNDSSTSTFGVRSDTSGTTVAKLAPKEVELTKSINQMLRTATQGRFVWTTL